MTRSQRERPAWPTPGVLGALPPWRRPGLWGGSLLPIAAFRTEMLSVLCGQADVSRPRQHASGGAGREAPSPMVAKTAPPPSEELAQRLLDTVSVPYLIDC